MGGGGGGHRSYQKMEGGGSFQKFDMEANHRFYQYRKHLKHSSLYMIVTLT